MRFFHVTLNRMPSLVIADVGEQVGGVTETTEGNGHVHGRTAREFSPWGVGADHNVGQGFADSQISTHAPYCFRSQECLHGPKSRRASRGNLEQ